MEQCNICNEEFNNKHALWRHVKTSHNLNRENYILQIKYKGVHPLCSCGCGEKLTYRPPLGDFPTYIKKHLHIIQRGKTQEEIFGDMNNPIRVQKIIDTRKKKFMSGEYDHIKQSFKEAKNHPDFGKKISEGVKGVAKPKPDGFGVGREHSVFTKEKMSMSAIDRIIKSNHQHTSKLETLFHTFLHELDIEFTKFMYAPDIKAFYDVYIPSKNTIIEIDGDYWHSNPIKYPNGPEGTTQMKNSIRDIEKNKWAEDNGYKMLRFWETDIYNNPEWIKEELKKHIC